jgi:hypothetical protein
MAEFDTVKPVLLKEYLRYSPQPCVSDPPPPEAMVLSPHRWMTPVVEAEDDDEVVLAVVHGRHWL